MTRRFLTTCLAMACIAIAARTAERVAAKNAHFEQLKTLAGTWVSVGEDGKPTDTVVSVFKVTAGGSAVQETLFPGSNHEMISLYHLDGPDLLMTHYCAAGNQPRMKLDPTSPANRYNFKFAGGTNLNPEKDMHMHEGSITVVDNDHLEWQWVGYKDGKPSGDHKVAIKLVRKATK